jgi:hypothetical protein
VPPMPWLLKESSAHRSYHQMVQMVATIMVLSLVYVYVASIDATRPPLTRSIQLLPAFVFYSTMAVTGD